MKKWGIWLALVMVLGLALALVRFWVTQPAAGGSQPPEVAAAARQEDAAQTAQPGTATPAQEPTATPTETSTPTVTSSATPSNTPTAAPSPTPTKTGTPTATLPPSSTPFATLLPEELVEGMAVPTPVPTFTKPRSVTNILLLGNDVSTRQGGRTDSLIIVSIDEENKTASMLSLPRDLYVVIPGWKLTRINLALPHGHGAGYPGGGGALVKDTILYNLGIEIDYYVRVGFDAFQEVIELLQGVDVAVSCEVQDWRLKEPDLDAQDEENWEMYGLGPGVYHMDGDLALWYVRSRRNSSDFDRGRRQQQVLRAILNRGLERDMLAQLPALWEVYRENVETDLPLPVMMRLAALAPGVRDNGIQQLLLPEGARRAWMTSGGAAVQLLQWQGAEPILAQLMRPPVLNRATRAPLTVEVVTGHDVQYLLAADNLATYGFIPRRVEASGPPPERTSVTYSGANLKGSYDWLLSWIIGIRTDAITLDPAQGDAADRYRVYLGADYDPCRPQLESPALGRNE